MAKELEGEKHKKVKATIQDVEITKISDLWSRKPKGLGFQDTDAIIITAKTSDGKTIKDTFYFCLKPDGTFYTETITRDGARARRQRLASLIKHYITKDIKGYNIAKKINEWKGKDVEVVILKDGGYIFVP